MGACLPQPAPSTEFAPLVFADPQLNELLPLPARRLLAAGQWFQQPNPLDGSPGTFHVKRDRMASLAGVSQQELTRLLRLLTRLGLHRYVGRRGHYVGVTRGKVIQLRFKLVPVRVWAPLAIGSNGRVLAPGGLLTRLRTEQVRRWGGARKGAGRPPRKNSSGSTKGSEATSNLKPRVSSKPSERASAREGICSGAMGAPTRVPSGHLGNLAALRLSRKTPVAIVRKPVAEPLPAVPTRRSRLQPRRFTYGPDVLQHLRALGARALPGLPGPDMIPPVIVPSPAKLSQTTQLGDAESVAMLARAYRTAMKQKFGARSLFMLPTPTPAHKDFDRLLEAARVMYQLEIPPMAWVLFSFDVWAEHGPVRARKKPPTVSFVFSAKRLAERYDWFDRERDRYLGTRSFLAPKHRQLADDHAAMSAELMRVKPQTRAELLAIIDRYFPGDSFERRVAQARVEALRLCAEMAHAVELGSLM